MFKKNVALCFVCLAFLQLNASAGLGGRGQGFGTNSADQATDPYLFLGGVIYDSGGYHASSVAVADVNLDGKPDLLVVNCATSICDRSEPGIVAVRLGNEDGTFQESTSFASGGFYARGVAVADINADGAPDLAITNGCAEPGCATGSIGVLLGKTDGTFRAPIAYPAGGYPSTVVFADVNVDRKLDIVVGKEGGVGVLLGNGDGTFQPVMSFESGAYTMGVAVADLNGDGKPDVVVAEDAEGEVRVFLGNGDGTFRAFVPYKSGSSTRSVVVVDLNGDGKPDLVAATFFPTTVAVLMGNGDGTFQALQTHNLGDISSSLTVAAADVNGDGKPDVLLPLWGPLGVLLGNGDGTFQDLVSYRSSGQNPTSIAIADVNKDDKPDAAVAFSCGASCSVGAVGVFLNNSGYHSPTTTTLVSDPNPVVPHQEVTYTATVTSQYNGPVTGGVNFYTLGKDYVWVPLENNRAEYSTSYNVTGTQTVIAMYSGDADSEASSSAPLMEFVKLLPVPSRTVVSSSGSPSQLGQAVTFTATVTSRFGRIPDGELVTFYDGTSALASVALASGVANYTTSSLAAKSHYIKAIYTGDLTFKTSTGHLRQVVNK